MSDDPMLTLHAEVELEPDEPEEAQRKEVEPELGVFSERCLDSQ